MGKVNRMELNGDPKAGGVKAVTNEFIETTKAPGLTQIHRNTSPAGKALWALVYIALICLFAYSLATTLMRYLGYPVKNEMSNVHVQEMPFPAVIFCLANPFAASKKVIEESEISFISKKAAQLAKMEKLIKQDKYQSIHDDILQFRDRLLSQEYINENLQRDPANDALYHQLEDVLIHCSLYGQKCDTNDFDKFKHPRYGNCFKLNGTKPSEYSGHVSKKGLSLAFFTDSSIPWNDDATDFSMESTDATNGVKMVIQDNDINTLSLMDKGLDLSTGKQFNIELSVSQKLRLPPPYGMCQNSGNMNHDACQNECLQEQIKKECKCLSPYVAVPHDPDTTEYCGSFDTNTVESFKQGLARLQCEKDIMNRGHNETRCNCRPLCKETTYSANIQQTAWPHKKHVHQFLETRLNDNVAVKSLMELTRNYTEAYDNITNLESDLVYDNFLKVNIKLDSGEMIRVQKDIPAYTGEALMKDIGVNIVLILGLSLIPLLHMLVYVLHVFWALACGRRSNE